MEIDKKRGERLRTIARRKGVTQTELSEQLGCSPVHLSKIVTGSRNLTEDMAQKVVNLFPEYRLQWLLGYDDYATDEEALLKQSQEETRKRAIWRNILKLAFEELGYSVRESGNASEDEEDAGFEVLDTNRKHVMQCRASGYEDLCQEIADFAAFKVKRWFGL